MTVKSWPRTSPGVAVLVALMVSVTAGIIGATRVLATTDGSTTPRSMETSVHELGVSFSLETTFSRPVVLSAPALRVGSVAAEAWLWPLDGLDHEGEDLDPLRLQAGAPVSISGWVVPPCADVGPDAVFSLTVAGSDGEETTTRFSGSNHDELEAAVREFCERGPTVIAGMNLLRPDGGAVIGVNVVNPGPEEITVEVPAYSDEHVTWSALKESVPPGTSARFEIHGSRVGCEPGEEASWQEGRLLIDGQPFVVTSDDGWC